VLDALVEALPATMLLAFAAMGLALTLGIALGLMLAWRGDGPLARGIIGVATLGMSAPSFFVAILVAWGLGVVWHDYTGLPATGGWRVLDPFEGPQVAWKHLILPALTLGIRPLSVVIQLTRNAAADVLEESYVRTARAKGLGGWPLMRRHVFRNAMNPVLTAASGWFASMLAGAVFVEYVFGVERHGAAHVPRPGAGGLAGGDGRGACGGHDVCGGQHPCRRHVRLARPPGQAGLTASAAAPASTLS